MAKVTFVDGKPAYEFKLRATQNRFYRCRAPYSAYFGGFGTGKTTLLCLKAIALCKAYRNNRFLIGRLTYPELRDTTRKEFLDLCEPGSFKFKESENKLTFNNGSEVMFRHLDALDYKKLQSLNLGGFAIDQAEEIDESIFLQLCGRLRLPVPSRHGFVVGNPEGHNWIWNLFKGPDSDGSRFRMFEEETDANKDNLPEGYIDNLKAIYPDNWINRYVKGTWDDFSGKVFTIFRTERHVIQDKAFQKDWRRFRVIDHGYRNPTCCLWFVVDPNPGSADPKLYITAEHYEAEKLISDHAKEIKRISGPGWRGPTFGDPSMFSRTREKAGKLSSVADEYRDCGITITPSPNDVRSGINRVNEYFLMDNIKIFENCANLIDEIGKYHWKELRFVNYNKTNEPEEPVKVHDHAVDCLRYGILSLDRIPQGKFRTEYSKDNPPPGTIAKMLADIQSKKTRRLSWINQ